MADVPHYRKVVADEQHREAMRTLQLHQEVDDLRADGDIERAHRLVADDKFRTQDHGARDADALALSAGEFMRVAVDHAGKQADLSHHLLHTRFAFRRRKRGMKVAQRFGDDVTGGHARI